MIFLIALALFHGPLSSAESQLEERSMLASRWGDSPLGQFFQLRAPNHQNSLLNDSPSQMKSLPVGGSHYLPLRFPRYSEVQQETKTRSVGIALDILQPWNQKCQFVFITTEHLVIKILIKRYNRLAYQPTVFVDPSVLGHSEKRRLKQRLWYDTKTTCVVVLVDLTSGHTESVFRYLDTSKLWVRPDAQVVVVGKKSLAHSSLTQKAFRHSSHLLFLGFHDTSEKEDLVTLFGRCFYCNQGQSSIQILGQWPLHSLIPQHINLFPSDDVTNFNGRLIKVVGLPFFPYNEYAMDIKNLSSPVTHLDSLDKRIIDTASDFFNFTYEAYLPPDLSIGNPLNNGSWTGMIGFILEGRADFTLTCSTSEIRIPFIDFAKTTPTDPIVIVSLKPRILPQYLVIIRPFAVDVWMYLLLSIMAWGISLWILQRMRSNFTGERSITLNTSIFYSWAVILEDPPHRPPRNTTGQILVGWWLLFTLVISTGFKSSMVANLAVPSKEPPIDSYEDLVNSTHWGWGIHRLILSGQALKYFKNPYDSLVRYIYDHSEAMTTRGGLTKTLKGGYSFLVSKNVISAVIAEHYTDSLGQTSLYVSRSAYGAVTDFGWGFPKGSPDQAQFLNVFNRLIESGISDYWLQDTIDSRKKDKRKDTLPVNNKDLTDPKEEVVLRFQHLTGVFLMMLAGLSLGLLTFTTELLIESRYIEA